MREASATTSPSHLKNWNPEADARYLDAREGWWQKWPLAQMDHGTVCISCHTVVPYALVRPALRQQLDEKEMTGPAAAMRASFEKRVTDWSQMAPFCTDEANGPGKAAQSQLIVHRATSGSACTARFLIPILLLCNLPAQNYL